MFKKWLYQMITCCLIVALASPVIHGNEAPRQDSVSQLQDMKGHWALPAVVEMETLGLMTGYKDGTFKPSSNISRAEFITVLDRVFGFNGQGSKPFKDVSSTAWYYDSIMKANGSGIISGIDADHLAPNAPITREDAAVMIDRAFQLSTGTESDAELKVFKDYDAISGYAKKALTHLVVTKKLQGYNGKLLPKNTITRAESAVLLSGMITDVITKSVVYDTAKVEGNLIIRSTGTQIKNTVINGNLLLAEGIQEGEITLEGVTVTGDTIIKGGGSQSVIFKKSKLGRVIIDKKGKPVRVAFMDETQAAEAIVQQPAQLDLSKGSQVGLLTVRQQASASQINSEGTITKLIVEANDLKVNGKVVSAGQYTSLPPETILPTPISPIATPGPGSTLPPPSPSPSPTTPASDKPEPSTTIPDNLWKLVWSDEFNEPTIDTSKWTVMDTDLVYNNELEYYSPNNAVIAKDEERSVLQIEARMENYRGSEYTSAKLISQNKGDWTYGKVVVRAKLPVDQGMWPAIWMMPTDESQYGGWPVSGEIDIMELVGGPTKDRIHSNLHFDSVQPDGSHGSDQNTYILPEGKSFADEYHDFQMEWLPGVIRFYVDGHLFHEVNDWKTKGVGQPEYYSYPAPFDKPFHMILNLAVGGDWPGSPNSDFVSEQMKVDFVRVYEYTDLINWNEVTGNPPEPKEKRAPLADGNQIYNGQFTEATDVNGVPQSWEFITNGNGAGNVAVVNDSTKGKVTKVSITEPGSELYSVQLTQMPMFVKKGKKYKITFEAKADSNRTMMSKVNQFQKNWKNYSGEQSLALTTNWQQYEYNFDMLEGTDNNARFEFNLGRNTESVYIANVKLLEVGDASPQPEKPIVRTVLPDGNLVYNGTFDQGKNRLAFWKTAIAPDAKASIVVNNFLKFPIMERQLVVNVTEGGSQADAVTVAQPGLLLEKNTEYGIYFDAKSDVARSIELGLASLSDNSISFPKGKSVQLSTQLQTYSKDVVIGDGTTVVESELKLLLGGATGTVYVDNVRIVKRGAPVHVSGFAHISAANAWEMWGLQLEDSSEGGKNVSYMDEGDLLQYKISVDNSADYIISARVASGVSDSQIRLSIKDETGATVANSVYNLGETGGWQTYTTIYFDPARLEQGKGYYLDFEGHEYNTIWVALSENKVQNGDFETNVDGWDLSESENSSMSQSDVGELVVQLPGTGLEWWDHTLQQSNMTVEKGKTYRLEVDAYSSTAKAMQVLVSQSGGEYTKYMNEEANLTESKTHFTYTFTMNNDSDPAAVIVFGLGKPGTTGGAHSVTIDNVKLYEVNTAAESGGQPTHVNLLQNGNFAQGTEGWFSHASVDSNQLVISAVDDKLQAAIGSVGDNPWDRQVIQEGFAIQKGSSYTLSFKAKAGTARKLGLGIGWVDVPANYTWHGYFGQQVDLTTVEQLFTFTFDATSDSYMNSRISLDMGNIPDGNAGQTTITISEISLVNIGPVK